MVDNQSESTLLPPEEAWKEAHDVEPFIKKYDNLNLPTGVRDQIATDIGSIIEQSTTDELTGLYNRRHFDEVLQREISNARRYNRKFGLIMIDFNNFKEINDTFGHLIGDDTLQNVAKIIKRLKRSGDLAFRIGGDEMAIIAELSDEETENSYELMQIAERVRKTTEELDVRFEDLPVPITISAGLSVYDPKTSGLDPKTFYDNTDSALYAAKKRGKNVVVERLENGTFRTFDDLPKKTE